MRRLLQKHGIHSCREWYLKICALAFGVTSTLLLAIAISTNHWIYMEEAFYPTMDPDYGAELAGMLSNLSLEYPVGEMEITAEAEEGGDEFYGEYKFSVMVRVHSGLWRVCQLPDEELLDYGDVSAMCMGIGYVGQIWNQRIDGADTIFSILRAMRRSAFAVVVSVLIMLVAQIIGTLGILKRNILTLVGGILMIVAALFLATGLVFYITAVNDEVGHRKKPKVGDDATFYYHYSWGFFFSAVSYLGSNMAAVANIYLYQKRFNQHFEDLAEIVPGLEGIIAEVKQTYRPSADSKELFVSENPVIVV